ncbi:MAG: threonine/serine dehydratase [Chloroflexi bacterium]|nr:threonine/serine dehydratase [Chloroflexota bacterium]
MITLDNIKESQKRIAPYVHRTPLVGNTTLSKRLNTNVYLKLELFQKTGSFKPRAAFSRMLRLSADEKKRGVVAVSGGNFAQGVAYAAATLGIGATIIMPQSTPQNYVDATRGYGAQIEFAPDIKTAFEMAETKKNQGTMLLHPYDDDDVMAGDGTIGLEVIEDVPQVTDVIISVGGGGLMSGITIAIKSLKPDVRVWSVETEEANCLALALKEGKPVWMQPTSLAKTLGGPIASADAITISKQYIAQHILVSDREAFEAQKVLMERAKIFAELAAASTLAAAFKLQSNFKPDGHLVLIICGGNVAVNDLVKYQELFT